MKCPLCRFEFEEMEAEKGCQGCPMHKNCSLSLCPNCGYEFLPPEPDSLKFMKKILGKMKTLGHKPTNPALPPKRGTNPD